MNPVLGVFGGTFDPIHCGHLELARELRAALGFFAVRFVPAGDPPHRAAPVATAAHRLAMVELAVAGHPDLEVDAREIRRTGRSYTVTTLEELRHEEPSRPLALIVGADAFLGLPTWHRWCELFDLAHIVVVGRPGVTIEGALPPALAEEWSRRLRPDATALRSAPAGTLILPPVTAHPISASAIRAQLARGGAGIAAVRGLLPPAVLAYIDRNQLYRSRQDAT
jgi:nicotinate-nucleotide adenylyltransferase